MGKVKEQVFYLERHSRENYRLKPFYLDPAHGNFFRRFSQLASEDTIERLEELSNSTLFGIHTFSAIYPVGYIILTNYDPQAGVVEVGVTLDPEYRSLGLSVAALATLAYQLFYGNKFFQKLTATCLADDERSRYVMEKGGWKQEGYFKRNCYYEGELKDEVRYSISREEYKKRYGKRYASRQFKSELQRGSGDTEREHSGAEEAIQDDVGPKGGTLATDEV